MSLIASTRKSCKSKSLLRMDRAQREREQHTGRLPSRAHEAASCFFAAQPVCVESVEKCLDREQRARQEECSEKRLCALELHCTATAQHGAEGDRVFFFFFSFLVAAVERVQTVRTLAKCLDFIRLSGRSLSCENVLGLGSRWASAAATIAFWSQVDVPSQHA